VNDVVRAKHLQQLGIQGLITDLPSTMLQLASKLSEKVVFP